MDPIGKTAAAQTAEDQLAISLSRLATPAAKRQGRTSRFWFKVPESRVPKRKSSVEVDIEKMRADMRPRELEHIDSQVIDRLTDYKQESPAMYQSHIEEVREFFLKEIAPRTISAPGGAMQATEVLKRLLDTDVDESTVARFQNMLNRATTLKMAEFVAKYFGLSSEHIPSIIGSRQEQQPPTMQAMMEMIGGMISKSNKDNAQLLKKISQKLNGDN